MSTSQITLPYAEISQLPSRENIRSNQKNGRSTYYVDFSNIQIRERFNVRQKPNYMSEIEWFEFLKIQELAQGLLAGKESPEIIKGDFTPDGKLFIISDGYRRYLAIKYLLEQGNTSYPNGRPINEVEVLPNPKEFTELDRVRQMFTSNHNLKLSPTQNADLVWRMKTFFKLSNKEIAETIGGVSRQWVDNMLIIQEQPDNIKALLDNGTTTVSEVLKAHRNENKVAKDILNHQEVAQDLQDIVLDLNSGEVFVKEDLSMEEELRSRKTDGSFRVPRIKDDNDIPSKDWTKEQEECIFKCNEIIGNSDKVSVRIDKLPINAQDKKDLTRLLEFISKNAEFTREIINNVKFK